MFTLFSSGVCTEGRERLGPRTGLRSGQLKAWLPTGARVIRHRFGFAGFPFRTGYQELSLEPPEPSMISRGEYYTSYVRRSEAPHESPPHSEGRSLHTRVECHTDPDDSIEPPRGAFYTVYFEIPYEYTGIRYLITHEVDDVGPATGCSGLLSGPGSTELSVLVPSWVEKPRHDVQSRDMEFPDFPETVRALSSWKPPGEVTYELLGPEVDERDRRFKRWRIRATSHSSGDREVRYVVRWDL